MTATRAMEFTASGNFVVPEGVTRVRVTLIGGGGGGSGTYQSAGGQGGGGGTTAEMVVGFPVKVTPGATIPVTVGAGGPKAEVWSADMNGTPGGATSFGPIIALGGRRLLGGGPFGGTYATTTSDNDGLGYIGELDSPLHFAGTGASHGGDAGGSPSDGKYGTGNQGYAAGGVPGVLNGAYGGGAGGSATPWGIGGTGGRGNGLGGSAHDSSGNTGGNPAVTNGSAASASSYGAGGGGGGGPYASYSAKLIWGGAGAPGYALIEWVQP